MFQISALGFDNPFIFAVGLALIFVPLERFFPLRRQKIIHRDFGLDFSYLIIHLFLSLNIFVFVQARLSPLIPELSHVKELIKGQTFIFQQVEFFVLADLLSYWQHRLFHIGPFWRFHAIHHSVITMDWLSNIRIHPVDAILKKALISTPLIALGFSPGLVAGYIPLFGAFSALNHANLNWNFGWLRYLISSPAFHHRHHDVQLPRVSNFGGILSIWDVLFGTFNMPAKKIEEYGCTVAVPNGLYVQLLFPFRFYNREKTNVGAKREL